MVVHALNREIPTLLPFDSGKNYAKIAFPCRLKAEMGSYSETTFNSDALHRLIVGLVPHRSAHSFGIKVSVGKYCAGKRGVLLCLSDG